jgi:hypothetical protein
MEIKFCGRVEIDTLIRILHDEQAPKWVAVNDGPFCYYVLTMLCGSTVVSVDLPEGERLGLLGALTPGKQGQHGNQASTYTKTPSSAPRDHGKDDPIAMTYSLCTKVMSSDYKTVIVGRASSVGMGLVGITKDCT